jgi:NADPH2:quinone reductase
MTAVIMTSRGVEVAERPVPTPRPGEVLIRMHAAPINPNDVMFLDGTYEVKKPVPVVPGFEGSGTVVATGGGVMARFMLGRRVACAAGDGDGTWAQYTCTAATKCAPLRKEVELDQGAMLLTNPLTAQVLLGHAKKTGRAFVQNAAAGAIGKMLIRIAKRERITLVNIVRREDQAAAVRAIGAEHVVVSTSPQAGEELRELCRQHDIRFGLDAIAGEATRVMMTALADRGRVMVYGMLSGKPCQVDVDDVVFRRKALVGFSMYEWVEATSMFGQLRMVTAAQRRLGDDLRSEIRTKHPLAEVAAALALARGGTSDGKILLTA